MLELKDTPHGRLISSRELYRKIVFDPNKYTRWVRSNILETGLLNLDYFPGYKVKIGYMERSDILITTEFAKSLCHISKTRAALKIREWLFECELTTSN